MSLELGVDSYLGGSIMSTIDIRSLPPHLQAEIGRLQQLQEQLQMIVVRRQQWESELREVETAISDSFYPRESTSRSERTKRNN